VAAVDEPQTLLHLPLLPSCAPSPAFLPTPSADFLPAQLHFLHEDCTGVMTRLSNFTTSAYVTAADKNTLGDKDHAR
jgi:hypothetical protein